MAKPTVIPDWISDGNSADATKITTPPPAKRDAGYAQAEKIPAQFLNWSLRWLYQWAKWLNAVDTGAEALGALNVTGGVSAATLTTAAPDISHAEYMDVLSAAEATCVPVSGLGAGWEMVGDATAGTGFYWTSINTGRRELIFPIRHKSGDTIVRVRARIEDGGAGGSSHRLSMRVWRMEVDGTLTQIGTTQSSAGVGRETLTIGAVNAVTSTLTYFMTLTSDTTVTDQKVFGADVGILRP